jgi:anti-anti-sigma factor
MSLEIRLDTRDNIPVIELLGRAVDVDVRRLIKRLDSLYKKNSKVIGLDVTNTNFMDSHALGTIVYYHTLMQKQERQLVILNGNKDPGAYLNRLFELTNLDKVLKITDTLSSVKSA